MPIDGLSLSTDFIMATTSPLSGLLKRLANGAEPLARQSDVTSNHVLSVILSIFFVFTYQFYNMLSALFVGF